MKKIIFLVLFFALQSFSQNTFPKFFLKNLEEETVSNSNFNEPDKIYVFAFWATWCAPCIQELDAINDVYFDWKEELNIEVIAISIDDARTSKRVKPMVNGRGWDYTILLDINQDLKRGLSIANPPYTVVVKNGEIVHVQSGHTPGSENELFEKLKSL
ncbi:TlpA family protein disulfide reductase [Flavobacterium sp.]|uniref:TlpA family protein disulfide reductase n=1 Tax=Flavobacterium sp. TaxID=239 RepID=UPI003527B964